MYLIGIFFFPLSVSAISTLYICRYINFIYFQKGKINEERDNILIEIKNFSELNKD